MTLVPATDRAARSASIANPVTPLVVKSYTPICSRNPVCTPAPCLAPTLRCGVFFEDVGEVADEVEWRGEDAMEVVETVLGHVY